MNLPPPIHNTSGDDEDDMAAAMGFSSFGTQPRAYPAKRKKTTHNVGGESSATGGNTLPLGISKPRQRRDEVDREGVEEREGLEGANDAGTVRPMKVAGMDSDSKAQGATVPSTAEPDVRNDHLIEQRQSELLRRLNEDIWGQPARDVPPMETTVDNGKGGFERHSWAEWKKGVRDERGDLAIYDRSFVEDPWARLRKNANG
ncbi:MAG: hypothetical protein Q9166_005046 [cf. Caloplaca sp. 2 TL-2023]